MESVDVRASRGREFLTHEGLDDLLVRHVSLLVLWRGSG
jgi:hypothetical protein